MKKIKKEQSIESKVNPSNSKCSQQCSKGDHFYAKISLETKILTTKGVLNFSPNPYDEDWIEPASFLSQERGCMPMEGVLFGPHPYELVDRKSLFFITEERLHKPTPR